MDVQLRCRCGAMYGTAREVSPANVNRAICYCHDCRAFAHWLEREDVLDANGGTEIVQLARGRVSIDAGFDRVRVLRLSPKGLHRFYAECCHTPLGNTMPALPFLGIARGAFEVPEAESDATFGAPMLASTAAAIGGPPRRPSRLVRGGLHVTRLLAQWAVRGLGRPTPLLDREGAPLVPCRVLTAEERQKLREHPRA